MKRKEQIEKKKAQAKRKRIQLFKKVSLSSEAVHFYTYIMIFQLKKNKVIYFRYNNLNYE